jgi:hypothetical protein
VQEIALYFARFREALLRQLLPPFSRYFVLDDTDSHVSQNSHRATRFNDNMDGTLTDLGIYSDPAHGDGKSSGGFAKPSLIVSKKPMSLSDSPVVASSLHNRAVRPKPTVPQRGGPRRSSILLKEVSEDSDSADADDEPTVKVSRAADASEAIGNRRLDMANPDRPYNMWRGKLECPISFALFR